MLTRPTFVSFGLTPSKYEELRTKSYVKDDLHNKIALAGMALAVILIMLSVLYSSISLTEKIIIVVCLPLGSLVIGSMFLNAARTILPHHEEHPKVQAYCNAVIEHENSWREAYFNAFWVSLAHIMYHVEHDTEYPREHLGFLSHYRFNRVRYFTLMDGHRQIAYEWSEPTPLDITAASKAVDALHFYDADVAIVVSPSGLTTEAHEYLSQKHKDHFRFLINEKATSLITSIDNFEPIGPRIPMDVYIALRTLRSWIHV